MRRCITYLTARFAAVSKRNIHWVALKHRLHTGTLARFYYVDIGTYCCFYYVAIETYCAGLEFKYPGSVAKSQCSIVLEICPTPNPTLNLPDSVNKCKTDIKHICWCNRAISTSLYTDFNCFVEPWLNRIQTGAPRILSTSPYSVSYRTKLLSMKTHIYKAGYVWC